MKFCKINYDVVDSTNDEAIRLINNKEIQPTVIISNQQTKGRGRGSHTWESAHTGNIYSTYCFKVGAQIKDLPQLTLIASLGIIRAFLKLLNKNRIEKYKLKIKWPNDILLNGKKIVGILTEIAQNNGNYYVVLGIGINVDWSEEDIRKAKLSYAGSISDIVKKPISKAEVQELVEEELGEVFEEFLQGMRFNEYYYEYNSYLINNNRTMFYESENIKKTGVCKGIDKEGYLLISDELGNIDRINFGEVNISGIYGY